MDSYLKNFFSVFKGNSKKVIIIACVLGVLLIFLSSLFEGNNNKSQSSESGKIDTYVSELEKQISLIVTQITGDSKPAVLITLETGIEYLYASENKSDSGLTEDKSGESSTKTQQKDSRQQSYITIKQSDGSQTPLIVTEIMPKIRGVVIVCKISGSKDLVTAVENAVFTALNINAKKVYVSGKQNN